MKTNHPRMIMLIVLLSYLIILIDNSLVFTCSKQIGASFAMTTNMTTWISNAYALTFGSLLIFGGRIGDLLTRRRIFIIGLIIFGFSSLAVSLAPNGPALIAERALQGCGSAIIAPATLAIIIDSFTGQARDRAIVIYGAMSGIGISLGLIVGAGITTFWSWRIGFMINFPITILLVALAMKYIPKTGAKKSRIDYWGVLLSFMALALIINGINGIGPRLISLVVGAILLLLFILLESHINLPILPLRIFYSRDRSLAYQIRFLYSGAITSFWFYTPRMLQDVYHFTPLVVGFVFLPMTIVNFFSAQAVNHLTTHFKDEQVLSAGLMVATVGFATLIFVHAKSSLLGMVIIPLMVIGLGQGLILSPVTTLAVKGLNSELGGIASAVLNVMLQIGGVIGIAFLAVISTGHSALPSYHLQVAGDTVLALVSLVISCCYFIKQS